MLEPRKVHWISPHRLVELNPPWDLERIEHLIESLKKHGGWTGRPILAVQYESEAVQILTGSHRRAAVIEMGWPPSVPVYIGDPILGVPFPAPRDRTLWLNHFASTGDAVAFTLLCSEEY